MVREAKLSQPLHESTNLGPGIEANEVEEFVPDVTEQPIGSHLDQNDVIPELIDATVTKNIQTKKRALVNVSTNVLNIKIDPHGGDVVSVSLPAFPTTLETPDIPFTLIDPKNGYVSQSGLIGPNGTDKTGFRPTFIAESLTYEMGTASDLKDVFSYQQTEDVLIRKIFNFRRSDYLFDIHYEISNRSEGPWRGALFGQIKRDSQTPIDTVDNSMGLQPFVGGATRSADEFYKKLEFDDVEEQSYNAEIEGGYMAMVQHYFVSAWVPDGQASNSYYARKLGSNDAYLFGFKSQAISVPSGSNGELSAQFYVGPKDQYRLKEIAEGLDLTVDYGFLWWLAQPLFYLLTLIHTYLPNWGVAIICLTIIVKSLLFPLSASSFRSMAKMRKLQPEMAKLKERYGDDRQQFSQAMMDLYKKEGANPLGGCFPILLQMPVFLALYWTLMESVELRQAPFVLWIHDLSAMDPYFVLPILMGISMYVTQMLQPEPPDPVQAKVFKFMPIMFTFFFLWFPSGLVLYWLVNNLLSISQQLYVTRQIEKNG